MPSAEQFLEPLRHVDQVVDALQPDFLMLLLPPAVLHPSVLDDFRFRIFDLLERRMSVHLNLQSAKDYGLPQERSILTVVASSVCAPFHWPTGAPDHELVSQPNLMDTIGDLAFSNLRITDDTDVGLICSPPSLDVEGASETLPRYVYNHCTGGHDSNVQARVPVDTGPILDLSLGSRRWTHPSKAIHTAQLSKPSTNYSRSSTRRAHRPRNRLRAGHSERLCLLRYARRTIRVRW